MTKKYAAAFLLFYSAALLFSDGWYISNAAGMALEPAFSGLALRADYALEVRAAGIWSLPPRLAEALRGGLIPAGSAVEEHFLYRKGELISTRWIVTSGVVRAAASFREDGSGYMDIFDEEGVLTEERNYSPDDITLIVRYTYVSGRLRMAESSRIRPDREEVREDADQEDEVPEDESREDAAQEIAAQEDEAREDEARESAPPDAISAGAEAAPDPEAVSGDAGPYIEEVLWTDVYRYSRSSALRSIERRYPEGMDGEEQRNETAFFPGSQARRAASRLVSPYSAFSSEFLMDISAIGAAVEFTTDERGRILTETRRDEEGEVLGTLTNVWTGERLSSVSWETGQEIRRIEFGYDPDGNRTGEKNYRDGVLERSVSSEGNRDVEELYLNGRPVLRAVWEDGRKVSEEPVRPDTGRN